MRNDKIIGALIGLVGAAGNSGWTEKTDQTIASALLQEDKGRDGSEGCRGRSQEGRHQSCPR